MPAKFITTKPGQADSVVSEYFLARERRDWKFACKIRDANPDLEYRFDEIDEL